MVDINPTSLTIKLAYNDDGVLDTSTLIHQLEIQLGGRIRITDWIDERNMGIDYPHLDLDQARSAIKQISISEYDEAIDRDIRREVLDRAILDAGFDFGDEQIPSL